MAGGILISKGVSVSLGGIAYRHVIELTREQLLAQGGQASIAEIYHGHDEACLNFISLWEQGEESFNRFYRAALAASKKSIAAGTGYENLWDELLSRLCADPRWQPPPLEEESTAAR